MMKYAILLLIGFVLWHHYHHPADVSQAIKTAKVSRSAWEIADANPDTRTLAQWVYQCAPQEAHKLGTSIYGYWCTTAGNPRDKFDLLPKTGWEWVR